MDSTMLNMYFSNPSVGITKTMQKLLGSRTRDGMGVASNRTGHGKDIWNWDMLDRHIGNIMNRMDAGELGKLDGEMQLEFWYGYYGGWASMSVKDAAERIGCTEAYVRKLIDDGKIKADKDGGRWLVWSKSVGLFVRKKNGEDEAAADEAGIEQEP